MWTTRWHNHCKCLRCCGFSLSLQSLYGECEIDAAHGQSLRHVARTGLWQGASQGNNNVGKACLVFSCVRSVRNVLMCHRFRGLGGD